MTTRRSLFTAALPLAGVAALAACGAPGATGTTKSTAPATVTFHWIGGLASTTTPR